MLNGKIKNTDAGKKNLCHIRNHVFLICEKGRFSIKKGETAIFYAEHEFDAVFCVVFKVSTVIFFNFTEQIA
jgi:hypothetical protein